MEYNLEKLRQAISGLPNFISFDDDGDAKMYIEPTSQLPHELLVWALIDSDGEFMTLSTTTRKLKLKGDLAKAVEAASAKYLEYLIKLNNDGDDIRVVRYFEASDLGGSVDRLMEEAKRVLAAQPEIFAFILDKLGMGASDFNPAAVRTAMHDLPGFQTVDDDGDVKLYVAPSDKMGHELLCWCYVHADHVTLDLCTRKLKLKGDLNKAVEAARAKYPEYNIKLNNDGDDIKVMRRFEASDLGGSVDRLMEEAKRVLAAQPEIWCFILDKLGMGAVDFNPAAVRTAMRDLPGFQTVDDDGDVKLYIAPTGSLNHDLLCWCYVYADHVTFDVTTRKLKLKGDLAKVAESAAAKYPDFKVIVNDAGDDISVVRRFEASALGGSTDRLIAEAKRVLAAVPEIWSFILDRLGIATPLYDLDKMREVFGTHDYLDKIDDEGDVRLNIPANSSCPHEISMWFYLSPSVVTMDTVPRKTRLTGNLAKAAAAAETRYPDWTFVVKDDTIRIKRKFPNSLYTGIPDLGFFHELTDRVMEARRIWAFIFEELGTKAEREFNLDVIRGAFSKLDMVQKIDDEGDILIYLPASTTCPHEMRIWLYLRKDRIRADISTRTLKLRGNLNNAVARAQSRFPNWEYKVMDDDIRIYRNFKAADYPASPEAGFNSAIFDMFTEMQPVWAFILEELGMNEPPRTQAHSTSSSSSNEISGPSFTYTCRPEGTVGRLQEAFTEDYPYLRIGVYMVQTGQSADKHGGTITSYGRDETFSSIRSFRGTGKVSIGPDSTPKSLEAEFRKNTGLVIKICYNDENDKRFYIAKDSRWYTMPIAKISAEMRDKGYKTADIH